ncbi:GGDEF domain-containing protein [Paraglaciecola sp. 2405UD69-4]|uniref:GGDEF domain-containing protein n=1 Tax=Paraglaciecola sp. 2405UD69-4 TaxID=3391836 RepID=UPI0039C9A53F
MSFQSSGQMLSKQGLLQFQSDFVELEKQINARLADSTRNTPASVELYFQKAQLYMMYKRADLLDPLLSEIEPQVFAQDDLVIHSQWFLLKGIQDYLIGKYLQADENFKLSLMALKEENHQQAFVYLENFILLYQGINRVYLQQYETALNGLTDVYKRAEKNNWPIIQARSLIFIGDANYALKNYEQALEYYQNAYGTYPLEAKTYRAEARMYEAQMVNIVGERSVAFQQLEQAMDVFIQNHDATRLADGFLLKSYFYSKVPDHDKSLYWIAKSVEKREELGNPIEIANAYVHYSYQLGIDGQESLALEYGLKAANLAKEHEDVAGQWDSYGNYANLLNQVGDYKQAYQYMQLSERALLKKARLDITSQTATLNAEFNLRREQLKNEFLDKQSALLEERNALLNEQLVLEQHHKQHQSWLVTFLSVALVFFSIMCITVYSLYRKNKLLASRDPLTNLLNRRSILIKGNQALASSDRHGYPLSVLMLDIDHFKLVNDNYGHDVGDKVIKYVADVSTTYSRTSDFVGRLGGEEFLIILPHADESGAWQFAQSLCRNICKENKDEIKPVTEVTVSIGIATKHVNSEQAHNSAVDRDFNQLIREADIALYCAKDQGRNQVQAYHTNQV